MTNPSAESFYFFATTVGGKTLDQGEGGGNPFASALLEVLDRQHLTLEAMATDIAVLTERKSKGFQQADIPAGDARLMSLRILPKPPTEARVALVLVFSDYSASGGARSLPGVKHDANRVSAALTRAGFETETIIDPSLHEVDNILQDFARRSAAADLALVYATGHGVEVDGAIYLLPGDYPATARKSGLPVRALRLSALAAAAQAKDANLVLYAGCRNDPFLG